MDPSEVRAHAQAAGLVDFHPSSAPTIAQGAKGPYVAFLHRLLKVELKVRLEGTDDYEGLVGDKFTNATLKSLKSWQAGAYLLNDGVAGYKTWMALSGIEAFRLVYLPQQDAYLTQNVKTRCWAAATATLKNLTVQINPQLGQNYWLDSIGGLLNDDPKESWSNNSENFAKEMKLQVIKTGLSISGLLYLMLQRGRVMLNSRNLNENNSHYTVLLTARGDGSEKGTTMGVWDPYPGHNNRGEILYRSYYYLRTHSRDLTYRVFYSPSGEGTTS